MEGHAEHRGALHERALRRRQAVDAGERGGLDRIRQRLLAGADGAQQVAQQLRVAVGPLHRELQAVRRHGRRVRRDLGERERLPRPQGARLDAGDRRRVGCGEAAAGIAPRGHDQPRLVAEIGGEGGQEIGRRGVHLVRVLHLDQRRIRQQEPQEAQHDLVQAGAAEAGRQRGHRRRRREIGAERDREQRQPRLEVRVVLAHRGQQALGHDRVVVLPRDAHERAEQVAPGDVRRGRGVRLAGDAQPSQSGCARPQLVHEARLADPGLARELHEPARAAARLLERLLEHGQLGLAPDEREAQRDAVARARPDGRPDGPRLDRPLLALHPERLERLDVEFRGRALQHAAGGDEAAGRCMGHDPRGEVHGVAHHGVGAPERCADVAAEDVAPVHAMRSGSLRLPAAMDRSASSIRSSSSPTMRGAPAVSVTLPPSASTSDCRKQTSNSSAAAWMSPMSSPRALAVASTPCRARSASVPSKRRNAVVTTRCSGCRAPAVR